VTAAASFCDLTLDELAASLAAPAGEDAPEPGRAVRSPSAAHVFGALHRVARWSTDDRGHRAPILGRAAAAAVAARLDLRLPQIVEAEPSSDGATKLLLALADGARVEAVHMPRAVRNPRVTLCISSQVGCAMGCTFCRTAQMGLVRNLDAAEIVGQVFAVVLALGPVDPQRISIVFMGMGEPLHNLDAVLRAVRILCEPAGMGLSPQRITVSTSGLVAGIEALARAEVRPALALSVNATTDEARARIMPVTRRNSLAALRSALLAFPLRSHEKITLEYVLLAGENDGDDDAARLAAFAAGMRHNINVIPWNPFTDGGFARPDDARTMAFVARLRDAGCLVTVRKSRGRDVAGACGQLATDTVRVRRSAPAGPR